MPGVAEAVAYLASHLPPGLVDNLARRLAPYRADINPAAVALAKEIFTEAEHIIPPDMMVYADDLIGTGIELAARRVVGKG